MSPTKRKRNTLWGRYDDYMTTDDDRPADDPYDFDPAGDTDGGGKAGAHPRPSAVRLSDIPVSGRPRVPEHDPAPRPTRTAASEHDPAPRPTGTAAPDRDPASRPAGTDAPKHDPAPRPAGKNATGTCPPPRPTRLNSTDVRPVPRPEGQDAPGEGEKKRRTHGPARRVSGIGRDPEGWEDVAGSCDPAITELTPEGEGETLLVTVEGTAPDGHTVRARLRIMTALYADLRLREGPIPPADAAALARAGRLTAAVRRGVELLGYGDLSERRMTYKLTARGADRETAAEAAALLRAKGLLREEDAALSRAAQDLRKLWGPRRIMDDLRAQGYSADTARAALDALCDPDDPDAPDFIINCMTLIRRRGGVPDDRDERRRLTAALLRLGYSADDVREAAEQLMRLPPDE